MNVPIPPIIQSKKFIASVLAVVISYLAVREGMTIEQAATITGPLYIYIGAQGIADIGKEKAKVENGSQPPS